VVDHGSSAVLPAADGSVPKPRAVCGQWESPAPVQCTSRPAYGGESPRTEVGSPGDDTAPTIEAKGKGPVRRWWWAGSGADGAEGGRVQVGAHPAWLWRSPSRPTAIRSVSPSSGTDLDFTWEAARRERASAPVCQASAHPARGRVPVRWGCPVHAESRRWSKAVERARRRKPHSSELAELTGTAKSE